MNDPNNNVVYSDIESQKQSEETPLLPTPLVEKDQICNIVEKNFGYVIVLMWTVFIFLALWLPRYF